MSCEIETPTLQTDPCNSCKTNSKCVYRELPSSILDLPENSSLEEYIVNLITAIQSLNNQAQTTTNNLEALEQTISEIEVPEVNYKIYRAILTQIGTNAPTATILENTIGNIVWSRTNTGIYEATLNGAFLADKTYYPTFGTSNAFNRIYIHRVNDNSIRISCLSDDTLTGLDNEIYEFPIEIIVYN